MNYYLNIKEELINNEVYKKVKNYSKNKSDLKAYYNVGKMLSEAGKHYGEGIIKEYSKRLTSELDKKYNETILKRIRQFYVLINKGATVSHQLTWSHYIELLPLKDINKIDYYIRIIEEQNLSVRELRRKIKTNEYERLDEKTRVGENDDRLFIVESKIIKKKAKEESCVIVGRCADYILRNNKDTIKIFLYSDKKSKIKRAVKYYGLNKETAEKEIDKINKMREKHYKFYTNRNWKDFNNYDYIINVDKLGVEKTALLIKNFINDINS